MDDKETGAVSARDGGTAAGRDAYIFQGDSTHEHVHEHQHTVIVQMRPEPCPICAQGFLGEGMTICYACERAREEEHNKTLGSIVLFAWLAASMSLAGIAKWLGLQGGNAVVFCVVIGFIVVMTGVVLAIRFLNWLEYRLPTIVRRALDRSGPG